MSPARRFRWWLCRMGMIYAPCRFYAVVVWPDEEPILPGSREVKSHSYGSFHWTPVGAWLAARRWEADRG